MVFGACAASHKRKSTSSPCKLPQNSHKSKKVIADLTESHTGLYIFS